MMAQGMSRCVVLLVSAFLAFMACSISASEMEVLSTVRVEDVFIPENCEVQSKPTDHLLFSYTFYYQNGTVGPFIDPTEQPQHMILDFSVRNFTITITKI